MISATFDEAISLLPTYLYMLLSHLFLLSSPPPHFLYRCAGAAPASMSQLPPSPPTCTVPTVLCRIRLPRLISDLHAQLPRVTQPSGPWGVLPPLRTARPAPLPLCILQALLPCNPLQIRWGSSQKTSPSHGCS